VATDNYQSPFADFVTLRDVARMLGSSNVAAHSLAVAGLLGDLVEFEPATGRSTVARPLSQADWHREAVGDELELQRDASCGATCSTLLE
jgi:hypothetical protein